MRDSIGDAAVVCFYYFDYLNPATQEPLTVARSLLRQALQQLRNVPRRVEEAYEKSAEMRLSDFEILISVVVRSLEKAYFIIDALDECTDPATRSWLVALFDRLRKRPNFRVFITCRNVEHDLDGIAASGHVEIQATARSADLEKYIRSRIQSAQISDELDEELKDRIVETIIEKCSEL